MAIVYVGIDLAKNVFALHGVDEHGKPALVRPSVPRLRLLELVATLPPCTIAMEACSGAHHWPGNSLASATPCASWPPSWWRRTA
jgi:transposase